MAEVSGVHSLVEDESEYNREVEEIEINGTSVAIKANLPSKSKLSQFCQKANLPYPEYSVAFLKCSKNQSKHVAKVKVAGVEAYGIATKKNKAEEAAAYMLLSGVRLMDGLPEKNSFQVGLQSEFLAGAQVACSKTFASNCTKKKRQERMSNFLEKMKLKKKEEEAVSIVENVSEVQPYEKVLDNAQYGVVCVDIERSGGPEDSEIIQLAYVSSVGSGNAYIVPEGGIDPYASKNCHMLFKRGGKLYKNNKELSTITMEATAENFIKYLEGITNPVIVCYGSCDWVSLLNKFALYGYEEKLARTIRGVLDFQAVVLDEPSLNKGSMSLVKLDTSENLTERVLGSMISRDEIKEGAHDARFDADILMRVMKGYMTTYDKDFEEILFGKMLRSQDLVHLAESKVNKVMNRRLKRMSKKQHPYKLFNGWWSLPGGVSVGNE